MRRQHREPVIFVISNRLPVTVRRTDDNTYDVSPSSGGLVGALQGFAGSTEFRWYGWPGLEIPEQHRATVKAKLATHKAYPVFFDNALADKHYNGFSNKILWPLLHYQTDQIHISKDDWKAYQEVNRAFAASLGPEVEDGDIVWIQDYHLLLMPQYLREAFGDSKKIRIGFFLHTVFPSSDFFRILPVRKELLESLLHCDLVGFHNQDYTHHFLDCCTKILHLDTSDSQVIFQDRKISILTNPVGIDPSEFCKLLDRSDVKRRVQNLDEKYKGVQLMISVDRLDYIKGMPLRIEAMDAFLTKYPDYADKVVLLQIVIPSREDVEDYRELHDQIDQAVSRVNGKHGPVDVTPIHSLFSSVSKAELTALYAVSDVCIVSSIRDGFNVVSLEYVVCQRERHGVLLLSEFAGASEVLDKSVSINPWATDEFADAIHCALTMGREEKTARWESLNKRVEQFTSKRWGEAFLESLKNSGHASRDGVANGAVGCASGILE